MKNRNLVWSILAVIVLCGAAAFNISAADGDTDSSFVSRLFGGVYPGTGVDASTAQSVVLQPDGKMLVGGTFKSFANRIQNGIARLNADGTPDYAFYPVVNGDVRAVALQADGKILIGGDFTQVGGQARVRVARLNADGTLDPEFQNPSVNNRVYAITVQPDGRILVGGQFDSAGGQTRLSLARLNANGSLDTSFVNPPISSVSTVYAITLQPDGKLLVGGDIFIGGTSSYFGRLNANGTFDNTFIGFANDDVFKIKIQADGKILVGGSFSRVGPSNNRFDRKALARFNADGSVDTSLGDISATVSPFGIYDFVTLPNGRIIVAGSFGFFAPRPGLTRLESDGTVDLTFDAKIQGTVVNTNALVLQPDGKILVGGDFERVRDQARNTFVRLNPDASLDLFPRDLSLNSASSNYGTVRAVTTQPDGKILVGGYFTSAGGRTRRGVVRINPDSTIDTTFNDPGITDFFYTSIEAFAVQPDGKILVGGDFKLVNGQPRKFIIRLNSDGSLDGSFNANVDDTVYSIGLQPDGKVLIGGRFGTVDGQGRSRMARLNSNGSLDPSFDRGSMFNLPLSITVLPDGKILAGGSSNFQSGLVRYNPNGTIDTTFTIAPTNSPAVDKAYLQPDGKILITGTFTTIAGQTRHSIARLNSNGTLDTSFQSVNFGTGGVIEAAVQANGKVVVGGSFIEVNGQARKNLARLNADGTLDTAFNANVDDRIYKVVLQADERILIGGDFEEVNGTGADYLARLLNGVQANCTYAINPPERTFTAAGGANNFTVTADAGCAYTATSNADWVTITSGTPGSGSGTVNYSVAANQSANGRTATITVNGQNNQTVTHTVTQTGNTPTCTLTIAPATRTFTAAGGTGTFDIFTPNGCTWNALVNALAFNNAPEVIFNNPASITINDAPTGGVGTAVTYPSTISVSGVTGTMTSVRLTLNNLNHTYPDDYDILLVAPNGQRSIVMSDAGGDPNLSNVTLTFAQNAAASLPDTTQIASGTFKPTNFGATDNFPAPAPGESNYAADFDLFNGADANGIWRLYAVDDENQDVGNIAGGWSLDITTGGGTSSWIALSSPNSGTGNATVGYTVAPHTGTNPRTGTITVNGQTHTVTQNGTTQTPTARPGFDFDGDGKADISVFRPDNGGWYIQQSQNGFTGLLFGLASDNLAPADYDGDGKTDVAVVRNGTWYIQRSQLGFTGIAFGDGNDIPVPADYDGDGKADLAVFRPSNGGWYIQRSQLGFTGLLFGQTGDKPVAADYDGDGKADVAVNRAGTWYIQRSQLGFTGIAFGDSNDKSVPADYDGDGKADVAVFRPSNGVWYLQRSQLGFTGITFGIGTDVPAPGDYDGDGRADLTVFRSGTWYLQRTTAGFTGIAFGTATDKPVPSSFVR